MTLLIISFTGYSQVIFEDNKNLISSLEKNAFDDLLDKWYPLVIDNEDGGFYTDITNDFKIGEHHNKMIVTQTRHIWTNSRAVQLQPQRTENLKYATHGYQFLRDVMWDKKNGGFHNLVSKKGIPISAKNEEKTAYGNSYAIYCLATYYAVSKNEEALDLAKKTFYWLEEHSHDPEYKGYFQNLTIDGTQIIRTSDIASTSTVGYKDQNNSIHLLEAFTALYEVWKNELVRERLNELLVLIRDTITTKKGYMNLFFDTKWNPISFKKVSEETIKNHYNIDHVSFGHDIETAYLLLEASHVLGLKNDSITLQKAKKMVDHTLLNGWDNYIGGFYDGGYYFEGTTKITIVNDQKNWWAQAEGLNSLLIMDHYFPNDKLNYRIYFNKLLAYTQTYLMDEENGGWYSWGIDKQPQSKTALKGHIWKATYHNFRALTNCIEQLKH